MKDVMVFIEMLRKRVDMLEAEVRELRARVTPLDPGSLPPNGDATKEGA